MATISSEEALKLLSKEDKAYVKNKGEELLAAYRVLSDQETKYNESLSD